MKRTATSSSEVGDEAVRHLWTGENEARSLLLENDTDGVVLQQARIADSITKQGGKDSRVRRFRISTETQDRHGDVVRTKGILLKNFRKNPVVLFAHDSRQPPIGKSPRIKLGDRIVDADVDFFDIETFEFADTIFRIVEAGGLKATSIGFMPTKFERMDEDDPDNVTGARFAFDFKKIDLLEFSIVPVPANPEAVRAIAKSGALMDPLKVWLDDMQDNWEHTKALLLDFDVDEETLTATRRAINGEAVSVVVPKNWGNDTEQTLKDLEILDTDNDDEFDPQPMVLHMDQYGDGDDRVRIVQLEGEFPKHTMFASGLIEDADVKYVSREGETIEVTLANAFATYEIVNEDEDKGIINCTLIESEIRGVNAFDKAHPTNTPSQAPDAAWSGARELRDASVEQLGVMSAWQAEQTGDAPEKDDFKFLHHSATPPHRVNFKALAAGMAALNGAGGGVDIPDEDRRGVWNHLARHLRENFNNDSPPELRWIELEPLKGFSDLFYFDYASATLLVRCQSDEEGTPTFINAQEVGLLEGKLLFPSSPKQEWVVHTLSSRQRKWTGLEQFKSWATDEGFDTEGLSETRHFWRLAQDTVEVADAMVVSLYPNDVESCSMDSVVQATLVPKQVSADSDDTGKDDQPLKANFALTPDGTVTVGINDDLDTAEDDAWALMITALDAPSQVLILEARSAEQADTLTRDMAKAFGSATLCLGRLAGIWKDDVPVYNNFALYRLKNGTVYKTALDLAAVDELQDFMDGLERLKMIVEDLSEDELQQLSTAKDWLDGILGDDDLDDSEEDSVDGLEGLLAAAVSENGDGLSEDICDAVKEVVLDLTASTVKEITEAAAREQVGLVD